jgi:hypothetical protein
MFPESYHPMVLDEKLSGQNASPERAGIPQISGNHEAKPLLIWQLPVYVTPAMRFLRQNWGQFHLRNADWALSLGDSVLKGCEDLSVDFFLLFFSLPFLLFCTIVIKIGFKRSNPPPPGAHGD